MTAMQKGSFLTMGTERVGDFWWSLASTTWGGVAFGRVGSEKNNEKCGRFVAEQSQPIDKQRIKTLIAMLR